MAGRIRSIKPELLDDEKAVNLSDAAWRLFVSSWLLADDNGNFRAGTRYLAAQIWQDTERSDRAEDALQELVRVGRIELYEVEGERYGHVRHWSRHQRVDNAGKPRVPPRPNEVSTTSAPSRGDSPRTAETLGEPRQDSATRACAPPRSPTSDLRPPTSDGEGPPATPAADPFVDALHRDVAAGRIDPRVPGIVAFIRSQTKLAAFRPVAVDYAGELIGLDMAAAYTADEITGAIRRGMTEIPTGSDEEFCRRKIRRWVEGIKRDRREGRTDGMSGNGGTPIADDSDVDELLKKHGR